MSLPPPPDHYTTNQAGGSATQRVDSPGHLGDIKLASWPRRTLATAIDWAVTIYLPSVINKASVAVTLSVLLILLNSVFLQARTYQSLGKLVMGISLGRPITYDGHPFSEMARPLYVRCLLRILLHALDTFLAIGFLRPLWNPRRQTFADSITHTVVMVGKLSPSVTAQSNAIDVV